MFLCWVFMYLGVADSQRRLVQLLARHPEWRERLGFEERIPDQSTFSWFKNHRAKHVFERVFDEAVRRLVEAGVIRGEYLVVDASLFHAYSNPRKKDESGEPSDSDATWAKEISTSQWIDSPLSACDDSGIFPTYFCLPSPKVCYATIEGYYGSQRAGYAFLYQLSEA